MDIEKIRLAMKQSRPDTDTERDKKRLICLLPEKTAPKLTMSRSAR